MDTRTNSENLPTDSSLLCRPVTLRSGVRGLPGGRPSGSGVTDSAALGLRAGGTVLHLLPSGYSKTTSTPIYIMCLWTVWN